LVLGRESVNTSTVARYALAPWPLLLDSGTAAAIRANSAEASAASATGAAYGRTTGVGANRDVQADDSDDQHGMRLVRSHATGAGDVLGPEVGRATMLVRAHQLAAPGSGLPLDVLEGLIAAANDGRVPPVRALGGIGTGDIAVLGEVALCLLGERPWIDGGSQRYVQHIGGNAALAFMSSSAPTLAAAALAVHSMSQLARSSVFVAAMGLAAVRANPQQWSPAAVGARPSQGVAEVVSLLQSTLEGSRWSPPRTQDPLSWRTIPFVAGPLRQAVEELEREVDACIDAHAENPRFAEGAVWHHGAFMLTSLGLRLDAARLALTQWTTTSLARLVKLHDPAYTGQSRFLASGPDGSSGNMVLEYTAASALDTVRSLADPCSRGSVSISIGNEDHASFASRGAVAAMQAVRSAEVAVACELLSAARALRSADGVVLGAPLGEVLDACGAPARRRGCCGGGRAAGTVRAFVTRL
jgi:histidine ammonia-lyase